MKWVEMICVCVGVAFSANALAQSSAASETSGGMVSMPMGGSSTAAQQASKKDNSAQMASMMMAAMMAAQCGPQNPMACMMAAMAAAQGAAAGDSSDGANNNAQQYATIGGSGGSSTMPNIPKNGTPGSGATVSQIKDQLAKAGATVSADGAQITLPSGQTVALDSSGLSDSGAKANGFSDAQIAAGKASLADAQAKVKSSLKLGAGNGGEMAGGATGGGGGGASYGTTASAVAPKMKGAKKPNLSGMSRNLGNDKIGVAADDIFEMISRRYKAKDAAQQFLSN